ncbi:MAG: M1 family aminopeptidase [Asticcacaulis sp.]|uniref:M1 family aminopeptidase n=1 Tax=Asticcacaulis sp. TaxID=1872648 RepID=UPI0039E5064D
MWSAIAGFELRYQLKSPTFWVSFILFLLMGFGLVATPNVTIAAGANVYKNAPLVVAYGLMILTTFFMFVTTAFGANVIIRDQETAFGPLLYTTRIGRSDYVFGRTLGAFIVCALCLISAPLGMLIGSLMPWLDKETIGPFNIAYYAWPFLTMALPSVLFMVAVFSSAATLTKSMMGSYLTTVGMLVIYFSLSALSGKSELARHIYAWLDPFGLGAVSDVTRYWTPDESNTRLLPLSGVILGNRLLFAALGIALVIVTRLVLRFDISGAKPTRTQKLQKKLETATAPKTIDLNGVKPSFGTATAIAILIKRTRFEIAQVFTGPVYPILMLLAMAMTVLLTFTANQLYGTVVYPVTRVMVSVVSAGFILLAKIIAIFYAGQVIWRERDRRISEIIDSTAIPNWAFLIPKTIALLIVLASTLIFSVAADVAVQLFKGYTHFEFGKYLMWFVLPLTVNFGLTGVLAIFVQALSPNKFAGWAIMVVYTVFTMVAGFMGWNHVLYMYGNSPPMPLSDMNGLGHMWQGWLTVKLYWVAFAVALLAIAHLLWRRGVVSGLKARLSAVRGRLTGGAGLVLVGALAVFVGLGVFIFYNTNTLNIYRGKSQTEKNEVAYEKTFTPVTGLPLPNVTDVKLAVDLYPHDLKFAVKGVYTLENRTSGPITEVYLNSPEQLEYSDISIDGAHQAKEWKNFGVRRFVFDKPMRPGDTRTLAFSASQAQKGFGNDGITTRIVDNGTFLNNFEFAPRVGITDAQAMQDKRLRRKYGLPLLKRMNSLDDKTADVRNYIGADWTRSDITVSTVADQTPVAPGYKLSDATANGRRTARFVSDTPILNFFSVQSAHYQEKHLKHGDIDLTVYYDAQHPYNVDRMLSAMGTSLDYYQANFSPFQFRQARILEFPAYATFAQSFANTIPYSEGIGFIADVRNPDKIDYTTYVTAHELGHQWWAHQIIGADKEGAEVLSETLAQYSALMVMEKLYGPDKIRRFLKYELNTYLIGRQTDPDQEMPLYRAQHEQYIHYNKGSLVMYLLKDRMGEDKVNAALRSLLAKYAFKGAPYPKSTDLIDALRAQASPADQALITDLFEKITLVDLRARDAKAVKRPDGKYDVTFTIEAHKFYAEGKGKETEAPFDQPVDLGVFTAKPGEGKFGAGNVLVMERRQVKTGIQTVTFTVNAKPSFAGIDPYNKWIDRDSDDNLTEIKGN